jgi:hypothetical protein
MAIVGYFKRERTYAQYIHNSSKRAFREPLLNENFLDVI